MGGFWTRVQTSTEKMNEFQGSNTQSGDFS